MNKYSNLTLLNYVCHDGIEGVNLNANILTFFKLQVYTVITKIQVQLKSLLEVCHPWLLHNTKFRPQCISKAAKLFAIATVSI